MKAKKIFQILELGEKLNLKSTIITSNIFGKQEYKVNYDFYQIDDDKVYYDGNHVIKTKDVIKITLGI